MAAAAFDERDKSAEGLGPRLSSPQSQKEGLSGPSCGTVYRVLAFLVPLLWIHLSLTFSDRGLGRQPWGGGALAARARARHPHTHVRTCQMSPVCTLTPHNQVSRGFVDPPRVGGQAGVGPGIGDVRGADEQTARLQQREAWQLDRAAGQDTLP